MAEFPEILITGGTGALGRELIPFFQEANIPYLITSRTNPKDLPHWAPSNLSSREGLAEVMAGKKIVYHLASGTQQFSRNTDVGGTQRLLKHAWEEGVEHFIYMSIVGIDRVPLPYYQYKLEAEEEIMRSGIPYTILRATQFHEFVDSILQRLLRPRVAFIPKKLKIQPIDTLKVAQMLFDLGQQDPVNGIIRMGGPEILELGEMAQIWLEGRQKNRTMLSMPLFLKVLRAIRHGGLTCHEMAADSMTWEEWVEQKYVDGRLTIQW